MEEEKKKSILYVDDEEINLLIFERSFNDRYNVLTASSGTEGLKVLDRDSANIDVVISDMKMFEMNGVEFIIEAKKKYPNLIYFILTGFAFDNEIEKALEERLIHKAFTKPFNFIVIEKAIESTSSS